MTTDAHPGTHYFCVDVETSALRTWENGAFLFSIGCVVVDGDGNVVDTFYRRVENRPFLPVSWYNEDLPPFSETQNWWREQNQFAKDEAYMDVSLERHAIVTVAYHFTNFVQQYGEDWTDRFFVADPDKFDWMWTDYLISKIGVKDPFWYHGVDMWSMRHGAFSERRTGKNKGKIDLSKRFDTHEALVPHHALSDAFALAEDLCSFLAKQPVELDQPYLEGYDRYVHAVADAVLELMDEEPVSESDEG